MTKLEYSAEKGLVQSAGTGVDFSPTAANCSLRRKVVTITAETKALTASDSAAIVILGGGSAATAQLPAVASAGSGWWCTFYAGTAQAHVVDTGADNILQGAVIDGGASTTVAYAPITNQQKITLVNPRIGDRIDVVCDGTSFHTTVISSQTPTLAQS